MQGREPGSVQGGSLAGPHPVTRVRPAVINHADSRALGGSLQSSSDARRVPPTNPASSARAAKAAGTDGRKVSDSATPRRSPGHTPPNVTLDPTRGPGTDKTQEGSSEPRASDGSDRWSGLTGRSSSVGRAQGADEKTAMPCVGAAWALFAAVLWT